MLGDTPKNQRSVTGYISGWRLWLSIIAVALSLTLLSQAHRIIGTSLTPTAPHTWTISAHGPLTPEQQRDIELQLHKVIAQLPQSVELHYSLRTASRQDKQSELETPVKSTNE